MGFKDVIRAEPGTAYMLTNEAIVRAALEADVKLVAFYPGAPQTEIMDTFEKVLPGRDDLKMEVSANEKVALETAAGAAFTGLRSLTSMKSVGTNVASDALYSLGYTGVEGGMVCLIADDPYAHSSQSEQDGRWFGYTAYMPMLEPSDPREAMEMVKYAFELSERHGCIVLIRTTTRVNHQSGIVEVGELKRTPFERVNWAEKDRKFITLGSLAREYKLKALKRMEALRAEMEAWDGNRLLYFDGADLREGPGEGDLGVITAGDSYNYAVEALQRLGSPARILKLGCINPLPERMIADFLGPLSKVVMVEELSPYLEGFVTAIAKDANPAVEMVGKRSGHYPENNEYNIPIAMRGLSYATGKAAPFDYDAHAEKMNGLASIVPGRVPVFCQGCPHRATFWSLMRAVGNTKKVFYANDIGCYSMMAVRPSPWTDSLLCMGGGIGVAAGVQHCVEGKVIATMGDSTFFHACLPGVANAVHNRDDITMLVLDNRVTAMTGQQSHPGRPEKAGGAPGTELSIRRVLEGLGVEFIREIDTFHDVKANVDVFKEALNHEGPSVVIVHGECALYHFRQYRRAGGKAVPFYVDKDLCEKRYACVINFMCPCFSIDENGQADIAQDMCVGCGVCAQLCPHGAIKSTAVRMGGEDRTYTTVEEYKELMKAVGGRGEPGEDDGYVDKGVE